MGESSACLVRSFSAGTSTEAKEVSPSKHQFPKFISLLFCQPNSFRLMGYSWSQETIVGFVFFSAVILLAVIYAIWVRFMFLDRS